MIRRKKTEPQPAKPAPTLARLPFSAYIFDFDGVILDALSVRTKAFSYIFRDHPKKALDEFNKYHLANGGISRFVKIRYFYEQILKQELDKETEKKLIAEFAQFVRNKLYNQDLLIADTVMFIEHLPPNLSLFIASGSEQSELISLCEYLGINTFFTKIVGSPTPKAQNIAALLQEFFLNASDTVFIGDSRSDYEAAQANNIAFYGYNNTDLMGIGDGYIEQFIPLIVKWKKTQS